MNSLLSKYLFYYPVTMARGEHVLKYLSQYKSTQWKSKKEIEEYQITCLNRLLMHVADNCPFYIQLLDKSGLKSYRVKNLVDLESVPTVTKSDLVDHRNDILSARKYLFSSYKTTGGSTGQPVTVKKNSDALARERAATWRSYEWAGVSVGDVQARFWGVPLTRNSYLLSIIVDVISNRSRLSAFQINEDTLESYYKKLLKLRPAYLYGYVSMIAEFASYLETKGIVGLPGLRSVITTSEVLDECTRELIENVFGVKVFNEYGCGEVGSIAHECEHGNMHIMAENMIIEIDKSNSPDGVSGEILVTDLHNYAMPLIRYRLGDYATLSHEMCRCGRALPVIESIHGRAYDMLVNPDGDKLHPEVLMYIFEDLKSSGVGIKQFQVIQKSVDFYIINLVQDIHYEKHYEDEILKRLRDKIHSGITVQFYYLDNIPREKSGKLRVIKSEVGLQ